MEEIHTRILLKFKSERIGDSAILYLELYECIKGLIIENAIPPRVMLPSTRELAKSLEISRSTVNRSYELLQIEGYIQPLHGSGYKVLDDRGDTQRNEKTGDYSSFPALSQFGYSFLKNIGLINPTDDKEIAFRPGLPPLDIFPVKQWQSLHNFYWKHITYSDLSYYPSSGIDSLKKSLATYLNVNRNIKCDYKQIVIVSGSLQSLFLAGKVLIEPGDAVVTENPTFPNVLTLFKSLNARIQALGLDDEGIDLGRYDDQATPAVKLIHVTPSSHYPTGLEMSLDRRKELLDFAQEKKAIIIENDYEHEVSRKKQALPTIFSMDKQGRTIYLGTFNRLLHPAIRIGFMVVPFYMLDAIQALQKLSHRFISPSIQYVMNQFIERKYLASHITRLRSIAKERKMRLIETFEEAFEGKLIVSRSETDVLHVLVTLPDQISESKYIRLLQENDIIVHPYSKCFNGEPKMKGLILGYSSVPFPPMRRKVLKMASLYKSHMINKMV